eukprot:4195621-Alexandrium_andersonii.AAC.1
MPTLSQLQSRAGRPRDTLPMRRAPGDGTGPGTPSPNSAAEPRKPPLPPTKHAATDPGRTLSRT